MQEEVIAEAPAEEVIPESAAQPTETTAESEQETKPESKEKTFTQEELDSIVQKRLAKESRRIAKLAEVEAENRMLKQQMEQARPRQEEPSGKPVPSQFQDYESYIEAVAEWKADQKLATIRAESEAQQRQREAQERASKVQQKLSGAASKYEDFEEVALDPSVPITQHMAEAIADSDMGGDVAYYLGTHRDEAHRIASLSPVQQVRELTKLETKLSATQVAKTNAPKPISPVNTNKQPSNGLSDDLSPDEWLKRRNAQVYKRA